MSRCEHPSNRREDLGDREGVKKLRCLDCGALLGRRIAGWTSPQSQHQSNAGIIETETWVIEEGKGNS